MESFDVLSQHEQILAEIEQIDPSLELVNSDDVLLQDVEEMIDLSDTMTQLEQMQRVVEQYGINPAAMGLLQTSNLLAGSSLSVLALEDFSVMESTQQSKIAMEGIVDKIKEKAAAWSAKVLGVIKKIGDISFGSSEKTIKNRFNAVIKKVSDKAHDATKVIKAHPYKSAMIAVATITAAAAAISFVGHELGASTAANNETVAKIYEKASAKYKEVWNVPLPKMPTNDAARSQLIKTAYGDAAVVKHVDQGIARGGMMSHYNYHGIFKNATAPAAGTWVELGWTKQSIVDFSRHTYPLFAQVANALKTFTSGALHFLTLVNQSAQMATERLDVPGMSKKSSHRVITSLFWAVYRVVKTHVGPGFHHIASALLRLMGH